MAKMGCGKEEDPTRPEAEYERYLYDLREEVKGIEKLIERQEEIKQQLEDEVRGALPRVGRCGAPGVRSLTSFAPIRRLLRSTLKQMTMMLL